MDRPDPAHPRNILLVGTGDTKGEELLFLRDEIAKAGHVPQIMDVGVLREPQFKPDFDHDQVASASGMSRGEIIALGSENLAMQRMAAGAATLAATLAREGRIHGALAIGGTMATDLALDVMAALPLGLPKVIVSTVAFSHLIPPERISPDLTMILWAGGLWGLNTLSTAVLRQAAGAVAGAARATADAPRGERPAVGISSFGSSVCKYVSFLKPSLEQRGYEVIVFHTTGMGGRALEALLAQRRLVAVLDLCLVEIGNNELGSDVSAGNMRLETAGHSGIPQIVAPAGLGIINVAAWKPVPRGFEERMFYTHNRLIAALPVNDQEKERIGQTIQCKLNSASSPTAFVMPMGGIDELDRPGMPFHNPAGLRILAGSVKNGLREDIPFVELGAHVNDRAFADAVLDIFDRWVAEGHVTRPS